MDSSNLCLSFWRFCFSEISFLTISFSFLNFSSMAKKSTPLSERESRPETEIAQLSPG